MPAGIILGILKNRIFLCVPIPPEPVSTPAEAEAEEELIPQAAEEAMAEAEEAFKCLII